MKTTILQKCTNTAALLVTISYVGVVSAETVAGSLTTAASSVDVYKTTCSANAAGKKTNQFVAHIKADKGIPLIHVQAYRDSTKNGKIAVNSTDDKNGDTTFSPDAMIIGGGQGTYNVLVDKDSTGTINYTVEMNCQTKKGVQAGQTKSTLVQNQ